MMKPRSNTGFCLLLACFAVGVGAFNVRAFSLLGPFEPWMEYTNGLRQVGDIGGPMELTNEYRWNVPVLTYGFDQSFLDYFGTNGVAAVESAIQILNDLPPASQIVLTNFPLGSQQINYQAQALGLLDLKSSVLCALLDQLGLTTPTRYIYVLQQWNPVLTDPANEELYFSVFEGTNISDYVVTRNYDPQNLNASPYVNEILYSAFIYNEINQYYIIPFAVGPFANSYNAVADYNLGVGVLYHGLTRDDVGGLAYLLSTNNVNYETLLPGVCGVGANSNSFVNGAWRPGVDKITFVSQSVDLKFGVFLPTTNQFTDTYMTNGSIVQQQLQRVTTQPDFLFCAGNDFSCTGTTNWINNADLNNNPNGAGPGIIRPPVKIVFEKIGSSFYSSVSDTSSTWSEDSVQDLTSQFGTYGTFEESTNVPIAFPAQQTGDVSMVVQLLLRYSNYPPTNFQSFEWQPISQAGTVYALQTSTNLSTWNTLFVVTNNGSVCTYQNVNANSSARFYRLIPQ